MIMFGNARSKLLDTMKGRTAAFPGTARRIWRLSERVGGAEGAALSRVCGLQRTGHQVIVYKCGFFSPPLGSCVSLGPGAAPPPPLPLPLAAQSAKLIQLN